MYVAVRRYEGVTHPQRVAKVAEEDFVPIISELPGFVAHIPLSVPYPDRPPARRCRSLDLASRFGRLRFAALPPS